MADDASVLECKTCGKPIRLCIPPRAPSAVERAAIADIFGIDMSDPAVRNRMDYYSAISRWLRSLESPFQIGAFSSRKKAEACKSETAPE